MKKRIKSARMYSSLKWNPFFIIKAVKVNNMILRMSATAAAMMIIWPNRLLISPRSFRTGKTIATEVVTIMRETYQMLGMSIIFARNEDA